MLQYIRSFFTLSLIFCLSSSVKTQELPQIIHYQGNLANTSGSPVNDNLRMFFRIFDDLNGGNLLWEERHDNVDVRDGLFSVVLGSITPFTFELFSNEKYLEIEIDRDKLAPRQKIGSVPHAIGVAGITVDNAHNVGIGSANPAAKLDVIAEEAGVFIQHSLDKGPDSRSFEIGSQSSVTAGKPNGRIGFPGFDVAHGQIRWVPAGGGGQFEFINSSGSSPSGDYGDNPSFVSIRALNVTNVSSKEFKKNISALTFEEAAGILEQLNPVLFQYKAQASENMHLGFIAEDVPESIGSPDKKGINLMEIVAVLTKVVQEQQERIAVLERKLAE